MTQDQLLERHVPVAEAQRGSAAPADRPGGELDQPGTALVPAQLDVHRTLHEPQRVRGVLRAARDRILRERRQTRGGHVNRFFEERAVEGIGLVEQSQHVQSSVRQESFQRHFRARDEILDEKLPRPLATAGHVGLLQNAPHPSVCGDELRRRGRSNHPAARREAQRLQHAGISDPLGEYGSVLVQRVQGEARHRHSGSGQRDALHMLVARGERGGLGIGYEVQRRPDRRGRHSRVVVHTDHGVDGVFAREAAGLVGGALGVGEVERDQVGGLRMLECAGPLGSDGQVNAQAPRGLDECGGAICGGRQQQKKPAQITSSQRRSRGWLRPRGR